MTRHVEVITLSSNIVPVVDNEEYLFRYRGRASPDGPISEIDLQTKHLPIQRLVKHWYDLKGENPLELNKEEKYVAVDCSQIEWLETAINEDRRLLSEQIKRLKIESDFQNTKHWRNIERASFLKRLKYLFTGEFDLESEK